MTEEEMMDLALRLSEQEASFTALRLQKEEEAVMKAIQESVSTVVFIFILVFFSYQFIRCTLLKVMQCNTTVLQ